MQTLRNINIGVRSQAVLVLALVCLWYLSFWMCITKPDSPNEFWPPLFILLPFVTSVFAGILMVSSWHTPKADEGWASACLVSASVLGVISCWVVGLGYLAVAWYL
jgi:hypothetical protein